MSALKRTVFIVVFLLWGAVTSTAVCAQHSRSAGQCQIGRQAAAIGFWTWPANTTVLVYIRSSDFNAKQFSNLLLAFDNWNKTSEQSGSGVTFQYRGDILVERSCDNCLSILRSRVFDKTTRHATEIRATSRDDTQVITSATIVVDPLLTNPEALLNAVVHELGHNLGLLDCYTCKPRSTVMNQLDALNVPNGMEKPTACDVAQVRQAYEQLKARVQASPTARNVIPVDEGEEPEDDDTPVVMPAAEKRVMTTAPVTKPVSRPN